MPLYGYGERWLTKWVDDLWPTMRDGDKLEFRLVKEDDTDLNLGNLYTLTYIRKEKIIRKWYHRLLRRRK